VRGTQVIHCVCCGLDQHAPVRRGERPPIVCLRCEDHRGHAAEQVAVRESEHAMLQQRALLDAQDDVLLARGERDFYHDRMTDAYTSRELLLGILARIDAMHHHRGDRCSCGRRGCHIASWIGDPRVINLIRHYDEEKRTLRELRNANPDKWADHWDYIDVSLVYPDPTGYGGRHRANG
jgi:hypothetical protein